MAGYIDLNKLTIQELVGVANLYPWFAGARKELYRRMLLMGADGESLFSDTVMYFSSGRILSDMARAGETREWEDAEIGKIIKSYIAVEKEEVKTVSGEPRKRTYAGVGDYFSQEDYDKVRRADDKVFSRYAAKEPEVKPQEKEAEPMVVDIFTETLAQIYAEQGYYEQAKDVYSKLILAYPEKNAYFASLIQKLDELN